MAIGNNYDPDWSREEFADEVMLAARFDADVDAAIWNADPSIPDSEKFYEVEDDYDPWNDVEQGRYDDDPSPYAGDYSEM